MLITFSPTTHEVCVPTATVNTACNSHLPATAALSVSGEGVPTMPTQELSLIMWRLLAYGDRTTLSPVDARPRLSSACLQSKTSSASCLLPLLVARHRVIALQKPLRKRLPLFGGQSHVPKTHRREVDVGEKICNMCARSAAPSPTHVDWWTCLPPVQA